ncbi:hypothetical protein HDU96_004575, partial [Phlyctochytrium bullatum]
YGGYHQRRTSGHFGSYGNAHSQPSHRGSYYESSYARAQQQQPPAGAARTYLPPTPSEIDQAFANRSRQGGSTPPGGPGAVTPSHLQQQQTPTSTLERVANALENALETAIENPWSYLPGWLRAPPPPSIAAARAARGGSGSGRNTPTAKEEEEERARERLRKEFQRK